MKDPGSIPGGSTGKKPPDPYGPGGFFLFVLVAAINESVGRCTKAQSRSFRRPRLDHENGYCGPRRVHEKGRDHGAPPPNETTVRHRLPTPLRWRARYTGPDGKKHSAATTFPESDDAYAWLSNERKIIDRGDWIPTEATRTGRSGRCPHCRRLAYRMARTAHPRHQPTRPRHAPELHANHQPAHPQSVWKSSPPTRHSAD